MTYTVVFDLETGGIEPQHPTIQLAAVALEDVTLQEVSLFEQKIAFDVAVCDPEALKIVGYDPALWVKAERAPVVVEQFRVWVKPYSSIAMKGKNPPHRPYAVAKMAGYNAATFDMPRLRALYGTSFCPCSYLVRDVLYRALFYFDERPDLTPPENFKLSTVAAYFGIETTGAHDALADARMTARLMAALRGEI
jgi:DNA polymerase III epsilon subunit-like protein